MLLIVVVTFEALRMLNKITSAFRNYLNSKKVLLYKTKNWHYHFSILPNQAI